MRDMKLPIVFVVILLAVAATAQPKEPPCLAKGGRIYRPGQKKVMPPLLTVDQAGREAADAPTARAILELVVNPKGKVCEVHVLRTDDRSADKSIEEYVSKHWHFTPATRDGRPVAIRMQVNFNLEQP